MRLSNIEIAGLRAALKDVSWDHVWLFGSRVDDEKNGGDVDILVHSRQPAFGVAHEVSSRYASEVEGKLDVLVVDPLDMTAEQTRFISTLRLEPLDELIRS